MSCGDPNDTDCAAALERMVFFIDNELADADAATIKQHLDDCAPCVDHFVLERAVKALVARSCAERAPDELRQKVIVRIRQEIQVRYGETGPGLSARPASAGRPPAGATTTPCLVHGVVVSR